MGSGWVSCSSSSKRCVGSSSPGWVDRPPLIDNRTICRPSCRTLLDWVSFSHCSTVRWLTNSQRMTLPVPTQQLAGASQRWTQALLQMHCTPSPFPISSASVTCCWLHVSRQRGNVGERVSVIWYLTAESPAAGDRPTNHPHWLLPAQWPSNVAWPTILHWVAALIAISCWLRHDLRSLR